ncbi:MAG: adenylosuccinate synthase [Chloroflexi bacterium]|nr:adenylosuccinate synthase [Chloroflexota bacterium]
MPATILIGAQWGDEGKGRVADWLARDSYAMARYAGGDNAGHTVMVGEKQFKLHLTPSGIVQPHVRCILGSGMVINPTRLVQELDMLAGQGVDISPQRIQISTRAHIITPAHMELDGAEERARGGESIGTTRRGIGPAYQDKSARTGLLTGEMADPETFADKVLASVKQANKLLVNYYGLEAMPTDEIAAQACNAAQRLAPYLSETSHSINEMLEVGQRVLCEGAQGTLLDLDHGHYPYLTSSSAVAGGALTGLGFGPHYVDRVVGVAKAYSTRVGNGPFPTELLDDTGDRIRTAGAEFGTTTGRPRRCGWLDVVILHYARRVNGLTELVLTKLDVLSDLDEIKIAVAYELDGRRITQMPLDTAAIARVQPVYETLPGWKIDISSARRLADLPQNARRYVEHVRDLTGLPITMISVGPERDQAVYG